MPFWDSRDLVKMDSQDENGSSIGPADQLRFWNPAAAAPCNHASSHVFPRGSPAIGLRQMLCFPSLREDITYIVEIAT